MLPPRICGHASVSALRRFLRWCWVQTPHFHEGCSNCGARWTSWIDVKEHDLYTSGFAAGVAHARREMRP